MLDNIVKIFVIVIISKFFKDKFNNFDFYYLLRFLIPLIDRYALTGKIINNEYKDIKNIENHKYILLPELGIYVFELIERFLNNTLKLDTIVHHVLSILMLIFNINNFDDEFLGVHAAINGNNIHSIGDIFIRLAKIIYDKNSKVGIFFGVLGIIIWIYTRNYVVFKMIKKVLINKKKSKHYNILKIMFAILYILGLFYTFKIISSFIKYII